MSFRKIETATSPDRAEAFRALLLNGAKIMMSEEFRLSSPVSESSGHRRSTRETLKHPKPPL